MRKQIVILLSLGAWICIILSAFTKLYLIYQEGFIQPYEYLVMGILLAFASGLLSARK